MKKILAVSGGVDSMVLLDIIVKKYPSRELVVATFDHGTRESSETDADFVERIARELGIDFYRGKAELGEGVSEEKAREERYKFLKKVAFLEKGEIFTAHHLDDLVETIAINFLRGTGFRGLACFSGFGVRRPFLDEVLGEVFDKKDILEYASRNSIVFRQDPTNQSDNYLRNRVREATKKLDKKEKEEIFLLWKKQRAIVREIEKILEEILPEDLVFSRSDFREMEKSVAFEVLRAGLLRRGISTTSPQRENFLEAILEYYPGKKFNLPEDKLVRINKNDFRL